MKKLLLFFCLAISSQFIMAQCSPDGTATTWGLHPLPSVGLDGLAAVPETPACIGEPYSYTFTVVVPSSFSVPALGNLGVNYAEVVSVDGLPTGLSFGDCNPAGNCQIPGGTSGCFNIIGTPDASNTPGSFQITVNVTVNGSVGPISQDVDLSFPPISAAFNPFDFPLDPYAIDLRAANQCTNSNSNLLEKELSLADNKPNPFSDMTTIEVEANKSDDYTFTVTNLLGEKVFEKEYALITGNNMIEFNGSDLSNGVYIYSLSSELGVVSKKMLVSK